MEDKNELLLDYVATKVYQLRGMKIPVSNDQINSVINRFSSSSDDIETIKKEIDLMVDEYLDRLEKMRELRKNYLDVKGKEFEDLPLDYFGLTINHQEIDLMRILDAKGIGELKGIIDEAANIRLSDFNSDNWDSSNLEQIKEIIFNKYIDSLISKEDYFKDNKLSNNHKINYLLSSGQLSEENIKNIQKILSEVSTEADIINRINEEFKDNNINHIIWKTIKECSSVEKSGMKNIKPEDIKKLRSRLETVSSITLDQEVKYGDVNLSDGTFDFRSFDKSLNFAKELGLPVRLNALIFYMDCPDNIYNMERNPKNKEIAKNTLANYVDSVTKHISDNYSDTVRSIDVFNELLNRTSMGGDIPYQYRGYIVQDKKVNNFDNIKSGWSKFLSIEDLCDVIAIARKNLPNVDFMYNDCMLEDPKKFEATKKIFDIIHEYERKKNIKLVDSIGTQMHIDNNISKENIKKMFEKLNEYGYPIEITEFDIAMTSGIEGLSDSEIEALRQIKINEIFDVISELREEGKCNIRGITIWSKTDETNFRVSMENENRIKRGETTIKTLHGGYYNRDYSSKRDKLLDSNSKRLLSSSPYQEYNYHTHTNRCGHAGVSSDSDYIQFAKTAGMKTIGFSDHVPYPDLDYPAPGNRMHISEKDGYIESIKELKDEYPDMTILAGYEAEYEPGKLEFLANLRKEVDYMILGQHYVKDGLHMVKQNDPSYPLVYAEALCTGMKTGLFDIVAHPDLFMNNRTNMTSEEDKKIFDENSKKAFKMICETSLEMGIPLEFNLAGIDKKAAYPDKDFWKVASEMGVKVIVGADAHDPSQLINMPMRKKEAFDIIGNIDLNLVSPDYNPVLEREKNTKLNLALEDTVKSAVSYEEYLSNEITNVINNSEGNKEDVIENLKARDKEGLRKGLSTIYDKLPNSSSDLPKDEMVKLAKFVPYFFEASKKRTDLMDKNLSDLSKKTDDKKSELSTMFDSSEAHEKVQPITQEMNKPKSLKLERISSQNVGHNSSNSGNNSNGCVDLLSIYTILGIITIIIILFFIIITII